MCKGFLIIWSHKRFIILALVLIEAIELVCGKDTSKLGAFNSDSA